VFSVIYGVLIRPLPFPDAARLVRLSEEHPGAVSPLRQAMLSNLTFHAWNQASRTVEQLAAYSYGEYTVSLPDGPARLVDRSRPGVALRISLGADAATC
jgi:putative ABC transport system permease protein